MIKVDRLCVRLQGRAILENLSFTVAAGECVALIGPNGAGKTTLLSCLLGDRRKSSGEIQISGQQAGSRTSKEWVAVLAQDNRIPEDIRVKELLAFFQRIYPNSLSDLEIRELLDFSEQDYEQLASNLSGGKQRFLAFVLCLIGRPRLLFLDEPTAGMDTATRRRFWEIVADLKDKGVTIFYTSHYIEEVEQMAERILVLHQGRLLRDTTPFAMRQEEGEKEVTLPLSFAPLIEGHPQVYESSCERDTVSFKTRAIGEVWDLLQEAGCQIQNVEIRNQSLLSSLFEKTKGETL